MQFLQFNNTADLYKDLIDNVEASYNLQTELNFALCGGKTPYKLYETLNQIDFTNLTCFQTDERYTSVKEFQNQSKLKVIFTNKQIKLELVDLNQSLENACLEYETRVKNALPLDLTILGIGNDGHFASIFNKIDLENKSEKLVFNTIATDQDSLKNNYQKRITLSSDIILNSKKIIVLLIGEQKKLIFDKLQGINNKNNNSYLPMNILLNRGNVDVYFCADNL